MLTVCACLIVYYFRVIRKENLKQETGSCYAAEYRVSLSGLMLQDQLLN
jgi:hypothetical protein